MQTAFLTPSLATRSPAVTPASYSDWPRYRRPPSSLVSLEPPESMTMTGIPAATAFFIGSLKAAASGIETTRPSGLDAAAASIICAIFTMSKVSGERYSALTPSALAASSMPFLTTDQYGSPLWPWVTNTMRVSAEAASVSPNKTSTLNRIFMMKRIEIFLPWSGAVLVHLPQIRRTVGSGLKGEYRVRVDSQLCPEPAVHRAANPEKAAH